MIRAVGLAIALGVLGLAGTSAHAATVVPYGVPAGGAHAVAATAGGNEILVGARTCGYVGRLAVAARTFTTSLAGGAFPCTPDGAGLGRAVFALTTGPDGRPYGTLYDAGTADDGASAVFRMNPDGANFQTLAVGAHPLDITTGPDGRVWFTENGPPGRIGRIDPGSFTTPERFDVPAAGLGPRGIVSAPNGALYVLGGESGKIWKVTNPGAVTPTITEVATALSGPSFGEIGPDGRLWFTLFEGAAIASLDLGSNVVSTPIPVPGGPWDIAFGEDGKAYVSNLNAAAIDQVTLAGTGGTRTTIAVAGATPTFGTRSPNGNLYFANPAENEVLELFPDVPPRTELTGATATGPTSATVAGVVNARGSRSRVHVELGPTTAYGRATPDQDVPAETDPASAAVSISLTGLAPGTTYHVRLSASNAHGTTPSADATFTTAAAPAPPLTVAPPKPRKVGSTISARWATSRAGARVRSLKVVKVPAGARVETRCTGRGCAFTRKRRTIGTAAPSVSLTSLFKRRTLRVGTKVEVRVLLSGRIGAVVRYTVRVNRAPRRQLLCLPVGATRPRACG